MRRTIVFALLLVAGCTEATSPADPPMPVPAELAPITTANTAFAVDLYQQLAKEPGNVFCSPLSISTALTMTRRGATGATAAEMDRVLHLPAGTNPHIAFKFLNAALAKPAEGCEFRQANALFGQRAFGWKPDFLGDLSANYGAGLREVDYVGDTEAARQTINRWVMDQTANKVPELFPKNVLDVDSRLVLANAVYFKGEWTTRFETAWTRDGRFQLDDGSGVTVPFMSGDAPAGRHWTPEVDLVVLPYKGNEYEIVLITPNKGRLADLEAKLTAEQLTGWLTEPGLAKRATFLVSLPKFTVTCEYDLPAALKALGMKRAFAPGAAELDGMRTPPPRLFIGAVRHKAFVAIDERGTEAAATTAAVAPRVGSDRSFTANKPFLFVIRHRPTNSLAFLGRVADPSKTGR